MLTRKDLLLALAAAPALLSVSHEAGAAEEAKAAPAEAPNIPLDPPTPGAWTLAVLPDTQYYSESYPGLFYAQCAWLLEQQQARSIAFALQLGDVTNRNTPEQWVNAQAALSMLDGRLPYAIVPGNHDYGPGGNASTRDTLLSDYFPVSHMSTLPGFGGVMDPLRLDNNFYLFAAGGTEWIVIGLEWAPRDEAVAWADDVLRQHPGRRGILMTHAYMFYDEHRYDHLDTTRKEEWNPHSYSTPGSINDGEELWQKLVRRHDIPLVLNGHVLGDGTGYLKSVNDSGRVVHQMLSNYQFRKLGGEGYMRLLEFQPDGRTVKVQSFSVLYGNCLSAPDQNFSFELD